MKLTMIAVTTLMMVCSVGSVVAADGKAVFEKSCNGCHTAIPTAIKLGDKAILKKDSKELIATVIKGKAPMPAKGGAANDADATAATEYMIATAKAAK